ncbi:MAG: MBL fold metallo-hydrolase [Gemmatimonadales bacterium]
MKTPEVITIPNGQFLENCYLVADPASGEAVMIDPGEESSRFLSALGKRGWSLGAVWLTHAHIDHIMGVGDITAAHDIPVILHPDDREIYDNVDRFGAMLGINVEHQPPPTGTWADGQRTSVGSFTFTVRHTPGHSPGSVSLVGHGMVFGGDVLFRGSIGRSDLPGGDSEALMRSIHERMLDLPDDTVVHSGHGPETTIGVERRTNPFLTGPVRCNRCGFVVKTRPWGCRNPCPNCGTMYPLGDCSD